jgi:hypothetical protein
MIEKVADTLITTLTGGIEVFFIAVKYLIYLLIIALPATAAYKIGRKIYQKYF